MQLDRFADGADVVAQIAVLFEAILHNDGCWFRSDETFHHQSVHIPFDGSFASVDGAANGFVAVSALVGTSVLAIEQIRVHRQFTGTQTQRKNLVGQRCVVFTAGRLLCVIHG